MHLGIDLRVTDLFVRRGHCRSELSQLSRREMIDVLGLSIEIARDGGRYCDLKAVTEWVQQMEIAIQQSKRKIEKWSCWCCFF